MAWLVHQLPLLLLLPLLAMPQTASSSLHGGQEVRADEGDVSTAQCYCGKAKKANSGEERIVGGSATQPNEFPWMAALVRTGSDEPICGGSLINDRYVLTAAQCAEMYDVRDIQIVFGKHNRTGNSGNDVRVKVAKMIKHPEYNADTYENDVALLKLEEPLSLPYDQNLIAPICLPPKFNQFNAAPVVAIGWGKLQEGGELPDVLQQSVTMYTMDNELCKQMYSDADKLVSADMICAGPKDSTVSGIDACFGDEGGPLMKKNKNQDRYIIAGITSWGLGCARAGRPGVYTRVTHFHRWIKQNTADAIYCQ